MLFHNTYGVDMGTDTIKISDQKERKFLVERNMIAIRDQVHVIAVGEKAFEMYEKTPASVEATCPMVGGVIANTQNMELVLWKFLKKCAAFRMRRPQLYFAVPSDISEVEKRAYFSTLRGKIKAKKVFLVEKGIADAIGMEIPIEAERGNMIINIGAQTTEISVICSGKVILSKTLKVGGKNMDEVIATMVRRNFNLNIGMKTAELLKNNLAYVLEGEEREMYVWGVNTLSGLPRQAAIPASAVSMALTEIMETITENVKSVLERTPPQILQDIKRNGIYLVGGVALIPNLADFIRLEVETRVYPVQNPVFSTIRGLIRIMNEPKKYRKYTYSLRDLTGKMM
ncbi:MAG: rod shape-determining protein [Lachnospiraceae bacterium]|nr:rod shape-determining protein [Lachnospiraceae bacterium]